MNELNVSYIHQNIKPMAKSNKPDLTMKVKTDGNVKIKINTDKAKQYFTDMFCRDNKPKILITEIEIKPENKQELMELLFLTDFSLNYN